MENSLSHLKDKAIQAHYWTSFDPEKRGAQLVNDYGEELNEDMEELKTGGASDESISDYKTRYERLFSSYLHAKSGTFSVMITGGSNFNNYRHAKANRSEERHYEIFREWRIRAKKAIIRKAQPVKTFVSELDRYRSELAGMQKNHELMKQANKLIAKAKKESKDISGELMTMLNINQFNAEWAMKWGFGLQNNNANMKRVEQRIKELEQKEALREENPITKYSFDGGEMIINYEIDRIQIMFTTRPTQSELNAWKDKGLRAFNWSPSETAWQRKITPNAMYCVKRMLTNIVKL